MCLTHDAFRDVDPVDDLALGCLGPAERVAVSAQHAVAEVALLSLEAVECLSDEVQALRDLAEANLEPRHCVAALTRHDVEPEPSVGRIRSFEARIRRQT